MALHEILQVFDANSREVHDLYISEEFLARFDSYHGMSPPRFMKSPKVLKVRRRLEGQVHQIFRI